MSDIPHPQAIMIHATRRFRQRCGVILPTIEYWRMNAAIVSGSAPPVALTLDGLRVFHVRYAGVSAFAIFKRNQIATFYPTLDWIIRKGGYRVADHAAAMQRASIRRRVRAEVWA